MFRPTVIGKNRLLEQLGADDFSALQPSLQMFSMARGEVLHLAESVIDHVYFPVSGMISRLAVMRTGDQIETAIVGKEGVVGGSIGSFGPNSFGQATVQMPGTAWRIQSFSFLKVFNASEHFRWLINGYESVILLQTQQSAGCHALHTVEARLCRWILQSQDVIGSDEVRLTQEFLSHMLGVRRGSVSSCAMALQKRGLIKYSRGTIKILSRAGLMKSACECYDVVHEYVNRVTKPNGATSH